MIEYRPTPAAERDLESIWIYTDQSAPSCQSGFQSADAIAGFFAMVLYPWGDRTCPVAIAEDSVWVTDNAYEYSRDPSLAVEEWALPEE